MFCYLYTFWSKCIPWSMLKALLALYGRYHNIWKISHEPVNEIGICILYFSTRPKGSGYWNSSPRIENSKNNARNKIKKKHNKNCIHCSQPDKSKVSHTAWYSYILLIISFIEHYTLPFVTCYELEKSIAPYKYLQI